MSKWPRDTFPGTINGEENRNVNAKLGHIMPILQQLAKGQPLQAQHEVPENMDLEKNVMATELKKGLW